MLAFLAARSVPATERIEGDTYHRSMRIGTARDPLVGTATVRHEPQQQSLHVSLSPGLAAGATDALAQIRQLFDIDSDPQAIADVLGELAESDPGLRLPGAVDPFEITVRAILGQQITVAAARTLATRFVARFGATMPSSATDPSGLTHLFPLTSVVASLDAARLGEIGIIRTRGQAIIAVAQALSSGTLQLERGTAVEPTLAALTSIRGIGPWTAHYVAMRSLGWADAFPPGDVVVLKALRVTTPAAATALAQRWQPWRAYAVMHLWRRMVSGGLSVSRPPRNPPSP